ncbi:hypothetical protein Sme01_52990 [Sphaerisporangium melleum]|uniref:Uncharacterized protein n=1 Tax=Sphaerisporangium melleum TaxID=321316 RepID=A0A917VKT5_9ACTN|nr:hypothetical protein [Sphaerisporangium melleum]GGK90752.1 hypothetical protein GCM10007964_36750 [Sphaerisporangium melleum]GII72823.1 hypothetical protein Sme01_52990 [Sphaerisporangium melleum]
MSETGTRQGRSPVFSLALTLVGAFLLYLAVPNIGPVVRAARADGVPGVFTAESVSCISHPGHESCSWSGDFLSTDGTIRRTGITLYGADRDMLRPGQRTPAVDIGRESRVYGPGGSNEWVFTALLLLAGLAVMLFPYVRPLRRLLRPAAPSREMAVPGGPGR